MSALPVIDDITLTMVQQISHDLDGGFVATPVVGLSGDVQQRTSRRSHRVNIVGVINGTPDTVAAEVEKLQQRASTGDEVTFTADIISALDLQKMVITSLQLVEQAGSANQFHYRINLVESPPLPPPAEVSGFGGLDDFGFGDLGFDTDILGDLADLAGDIAGAVDAAMGAISALDALANIGDLGFDGVLAPMDEIGTGLADLGARFGSAAGSLREVFG